MALPVIWDLPNWPGLIIKDRECLYKLFHLSTPGLLPDSPTDLSRASVALQVTNHFLLDYRSTGLLTVPVSWLSGLLHLFITSLLLKAEAKEAFSSSAISSCLMTIFLPHIQ